MLAQRDTTRTTLRALTHPITIAAIVILIINDHVLKAAYPGLITGKLSDFAGLVFFPVLLTGMLGVVQLRPRAATNWAIAIAAAWFTAIKTLPFAAAATQSLAMAITGSSHIVVDPWDLVALPTLALAAYVLHHAQKRPIPKRGMARRRDLQLALLIIAAMASLASSCEFSDGVTRVSNDGVRSTEACLEDGHCFRIDGGPYVLESVDGETWSKAWELPPGRLEFLERFGDECDPYEVKARDIKVIDQEKQTIAVAMGDYGLLRRLSDGTWMLDPVDVAEPIERFGTNLQPEQMITTGIVLGLLVVMTALAAAITGATTVGMWRALVLLVLGLTSYGFMNSMHTDIATIDMLVGAGTVSGMLGFAVIAYVWKEIGLLRSLGYTTVVIVLAASAGYIPFYAWSGGAISRRSTAALIATSILLVGLAVLLILLSRLRTAVATDDTSDDTVQTEAGTGPSQSWLAAAVLSAVFFGSLAYRLPQATSYTFALTLLPVAAYLSARCSDQRSPWYPAFAGIAAAYLSWFVLPGHSPSLAALALAVLTIKPRPDEARIVRWLLAVGGAIAIWSLQQTATAELPRDGSVPPIDWLSVTIPFLVVLGDRLTAWWLRWFAAHTHNVTESTTS